MFDLSSIQTHMNLIEPVSLTLCLGSIDEYMNISRITTPSFFFSRSWGLGSRSIFVVTCFPEAPLGPYFGWPWLLWPCLGSNPFMGDDLWLPSSCVCLYSNPIQCEGLQHLYVCTYIHTCMNGEVNVKYSSICIFIHT